MILQPPTHEPGSGQRGFSLIEILVAVAIIGMMSVLLYGAFKDTFDTQTEVDRSQERWHVLRIGMSRMVRDLSMAYVSMNENMLEKDRRTYFVSKRGFDGDELTFTSFAHRRTVADAKEPDQCAIRYYLAPDPDDSGKTNLMRRETRRIAYKPFEDIPGESYILIEDVENISYEFFDPVKDEWTEEWDTTSVDGQPNRIPPRIRIFLTIKDEKGRDLTLVTEARIMLTDAVNLTPPARGGRLGPTVGGRAGGRGRFGKGPFGGLGSSTRMPGGGIMGGGRK